MEANFLVIGGGIGGAVFAELVARGGKRVIVLEKTGAPPNWVRPEILWPATAEVLFRLVPKMVLATEAMLPLQGVTISDGRKVIPFITSEMLQQTQIQPWSTDANQTREQLLRHRCFELRRGREVIAVLRERNRPMGVRTRDVGTGEESKVFAQYIVGDDGVHSLVRESCNIRMKTSLLPLEFLCFAFDWPRSLPTAIARAWLNVGRPASGIFSLLAVPTPPQKRRRACRRATESLRGGLCTRGLGRILLPGSSGRRCGWQQATPPRFRTNSSTLGPRSALWSRRGHLDRDAAHPVSPAGGQGANMSVADACVLAEIALSGDENLLREYERRRRPANDRSMRFTRVAARVLRLPDWCLPVSIFWAAVRVAGRYPYLMRGFLRSAATAFVSRDN